MTALSMARRMRSGTGAGPGICRKCRPGIRGVLLAISPRLLFKKGAFLSHDWPLYTRAWDSINTPHDDRSKSRLGAAAQGRKCRRSAVRRLHARALRHRCVVLSDDALGRRRAEDDR